MRFARTVAVIAATAGIAFASVASADDSGSFVVQLGQDTTSVESYTRSATRLEVYQVARTPRVLRRHFVYDFASGTLSAFSMVVNPPGAPPTQTIHATWAADSLQLETKTGDAPLKISKVGLPAGTLFVASSSPWTTYETQMLKLVQSKQPELAAPLLFLGAPAPLQVRVRTLAAGSVELSNDRGDLFQVAVDKHGHIQAVTPVAGTGQFTVTRVKSLDLDRMAADFAAREKAGTGLGVLSPRDTVTAANVGGATLWVDYGRPHRRGRVVFGKVVPWGEVWRTGANAATQFKTDKALDFGGTVVPAGFYTLWTIPAAQGWKLVVNSETGQWGTAHNAAKDVFTIDMQVTALPEPLETFTIGVDPTPQGGVLRFDWDTTRASAAFKVVE